MARFKFLKIVIGLDNFYKVFIDQQAKIKINQNMHTETHLIRLLCKIFFKNCMYTNSIDSHLKKNLLYICN